MSEDEELKTGDRREKIILALPHSAMSGFLTFVRERGVAGFAVGFILGGAVGKLVQALTDDIINPFLNLFIGYPNRISDFAIGNFKVGDFVSALINFFLLCFVVYLLFRVLRLEDLEKPRK